MSEKNKGRLSIAATAVLWGLAGVCVKSITWSSLSIMSVRSLVSLIVLLIVRRSWKIRFTKNNLFGGIMMMLTGTLYMQAIKMTTAGTAIVLQYVAPILIYLYAVLFKKRKMRPVEALIILAVFGGCVLSFSDNLDARHVVGNLFGLASGVTYAAQIICMGRKDCDSEDTTLIGNLLGVGLLFPFIFFDSGVSFTAQNLIWLSIMSVFQYSIANMLFIYGIDRVEDVEASLILTIEPVFNPIPVALFCGEMMTVRGWTGAAIVIGFVTLYSALPAVENKLARRKMEPLS